MISFTDHNTHIEITDLDITNVSVAELSELQKLLYKHLIVVIRDQDTDPRYFARLNAFMGPLANVNQWATTRHGNFVDEIPKSAPDFETWPDPDTYPIQRVSGMKKNGQPTGIFGTGILDWHCNLNGPERADGLGLQALEGVKGTVTSWMNSGTALKDASDEFKNQLSEAYAEYKYDPETWAKGTNQQQLDFMMRNSFDYKMWLLQQNRSGTKGIYFHKNNKCKVISKHDNLQKDIEDYLFQDKYQYHHHWQEGDVVLSDQILTLHKRQTNDSDKLSKRVLNRITFRLSNTDGYVESNNTFKQG
jgi:alpha-ketoglutarate-dependent taurine dioxygenase